MATDDGQFERRVLRSIDEGLSELGRGLGDSLFRYLRLVKGVGRDQVVAHPEDFDLALWAIFGEGTPFVLQLIITSLASEFGMTGTPRSFSEALKMTAKR